MAQLRRLARQRRARDESGLFLLEGPTGLAEALQIGAIPTEVMVEADSSVVPDEVLDHLDRLGVEVFEVEAGLFASAVPAKNPQGVVAVMGHVHRELDQVLGDAPTFVVVGVDVSDPGNAGTIIRTAAASGADAVVFAGDSVDCYNPKVVRSTAGALLRIDVVRSQETAVLCDRLAAAGIETVGLAGAAELALADVTFTAPVAVVLGNESHGLSAADQARLDRLVRIPMANDVESLNVAAAAAVVCFEVVRQRG